MNVTYQSASNTATNGTALGAAKQDVIVYKVMVGLPVATGNIILYNKSVAFSGDTSNIAFKATIPAAVSYQYTNANGNKTEWDFGPNGLQLDGGNLMIDQTMQVTVLWEPKDESRP